MRRIAMLLLLLAAAPLSAARADDAAAWAALKRGGVVALMRHADAPGAGDPPGWRLDDCATQRNLSERGRADARAVGDALRAARVPVAQLLSSPWCRCIDTARLLDIGTPRIEPAFSNMVMLPERRAALADAGRAVISRFAGPGTLVVVTHGANIQALTGHHPASGEIVVVQAAADGSLRRLGEIAAPAR